MKYRLIEAEKAEHTISRLCKVLGVTRQGFYAWRRRGPSLRSLDDAELARLIVTIYDGSLQTYGAPRIQLELADEHDVHVGRKRVARLMRGLEIEGVSRRGKKRRTTVPDPKQPPAPDLVERTFGADAPDQLWAADITYLPTWSGFLYLAVVLDACSRKVVGWAMADHLRAELVVDALEMALWNRRPRPGVLHHSDRGGQYTSLAFGRRCREAGILPSMGRVGNAYDNAMAEAFFATLETELLTRRTFPHRGAARAALFDYIEGFYNSHRRHSALGYLSPAAYERRWQESVRSA